MSAKGRKRKDAPATEVAAFEFYPTPTEAILSIIESPLIDLPGGLWIDPCAGTGRIPRAVNGTRRDVSWILVEIDERHRPALENLIAGRPSDVLLPFGDFVHRQWKASHFAEAMIFNPPFSHALDFVRAGFDRAGQLLMLQRLNWLAPARASWLRDHMPDVYVLPSRPSFTADGSTDAAEYAWFHWPFGSTCRRSGLVAMLDKPRQLSWLPEAA